MPLPKFGRKKEVPKEASPKDRDRQTSAAPGAKPASDPRTDAGSKKSKEAPPKPGVPLRVLVAAPDPKPLSDLLLAMGVKEVKSLRTLPETPSREIASSFSSSGSQILVFQPHGRVAIPESLKSDLGVKPPHDLILVLDDISPVQMMEAKNAEVNHTLRWMPKRDEIRETLFLIADRNGLPSPPGLRELPPHLQKIKRLEAINFAELKQEVVDTGKCMRCYACVSFCSSAQYAALTIREDGLPDWLNQDKCIKCSICYDICPVTFELEAESRTQWRVDGRMGPVMEVATFRSADEEIRARATDGGFVTGFLNFLLENNLIDAALLSKRTSPWSNKPVFARSRQELLEACGASLSMSYNIDEMSDYTTFGRSLTHLRGLRDVTQLRVASVGLPCQTHALRKMQTLGVTPSHIVTFAIGLFCTKVVQFPKEKRPALEALIGAPMSDIVKVWVKDKFYFKLRSGRVTGVDFERLDEFSPEGCQKCTLYTSWDADISVGGNGAELGWTMVITRTEQARELVGMAERAGVIERGPVPDLEAVRRVADWKMDHGVRFGGTPLEFVSEAAAKGRT
ncbi:MAG TPA: Coenzyme F420 hydrogenase/dehydrogenase, beta subunit C-terminal domain [Thermoplasmata archaeon]|nr:Coenzyme F420 hydrogenase/dehydrogenase, beta subunit C-terminal domain [Thermoplasmata archaeon]